MKLLSLLANTPILVALLFLQSVYMPNLADSESDAMGVGSSRPSYAQLRKIRKERGREKKERTQQLEHRRKMAHEGSQKVIHNYGAGKKGRNRHRGQKQGQAPPKAHNRMPNKEIR